MPGLLAGKLNFHNVIARNPRNCPDREVNARQRQELVPVRGVEAPSPVFGNQESSPWPYWGLLPAIGCQLFFWPADGSISTGRNSRPNLRLPQRRSLCAAPSSSSSRGI